MSDINLKLLMRVLKQHGWKNSIKDGATKAARVLLYFHQNKATHYPTMQRDLKMSEGGMAKLFMNLRKRGLLLRQKVRHYTITPLAQELLRKAFVR